MSSSKSQSGILHSGTPRPYQASGATTHTMTSYTNELPNTVVAIQMTTAQANVKNFTAKSRDGTEKQLYSRLQTKT